MTHSRRSGHTAATDWRSRLVRAARMGLDELRTRARQELAKHWDATLYRLGVPFGGGAGSPGLQNGARFLFQSKELPELIAVLRERVPEQVEGIVRRAEGICSHRFDLLGYEQLDCGPEIDWHLDIVHDKRAPRVPWFRIHYLDFEEVGDAKIIWELNRHQHLVTLAKAYRLTEDQRFAAELFRQWYHWWQENPYPIGINWASSLEVAFRSLSWLWVRHLLEGCPVTPSDFHEDLLRALAISGCHIERYLSTYFSPNTHLLGEAVALFFLGTLCPQLVAAKRWQRRGWEIILQEATRQVQADGMHFEQSIYYHVYALDFLLHARMLAAASQIPIPSQFDRTLEKMLEVLCRLSQAGVPPRLGDDDGGRVFDPQRNRAQHLVDPLVIGAVLFGRPEFKAAGNVSEEAIWLLGRDGIAQFDRLATTLPAQSSIGFEASGIYVMAGGQRVPQQMVIDAGQLGTGRAGHGHADTLSLCLTVKGREWLADPGTFAYASGGSERDLFRGTAAHNTLQVDGVSQAEPLGPFAWGSQPEVRVENWIAAEGFDLLVASHFGYSRLASPVVHRRSVFHLKSRFWFVLDLAEGDGVHRLELFWHLAPGSQALVKTAAGTYFAAEDQSGLALLSAEGHDWAQEISEGWWSPAYGRKEPCPVLHFQKETRLPAAFATLLRPVAENPVKLGHLVAMRTTAMDGVALGYQYNTPDECHYIFCATHGRRWESGMWASDASFLYCGMDPRGRLCHLALCGGRYVEMHGHRIFAARRSVARCEWLLNEPVTQVFCSDGDAIELLPEMSSCDPDVVLASDRAQGLEKGAS